MLGKMNKRAWLIVAIVILAVVGGIWWYKAKSSKGSVTYQTAQVSKGTLVVSVSGTGNVIVDKKANVNPGISGEVKDLSVGVGDQVKKGQLLFRVVNDQLDIAVNKANVSYLQAQQALENAKTQLLEAQNAREDLNYDDPNDKIAPASDAEKSAADQKVVAAELSVKSSEVNVDSAYADYKLQQENAAKRTCARLLMEP